MGFMAAVASVVSCLTGSNRSTKAKEPSTNQKLWNALESTNEKIKTLESDYKNGKVSKVEFDKLMFDYRSQQDIILAMADASNPFSDIGL